MKPLIARIQELEKELLASKEEVGMKGSLLEDSASIITAKDEQIASYTANIDKLSARVAASAEISGKERQEMELKLTSIMQDKDQTIESLRKQLESQVTGLHQEVSRSNDFFLETVETHADETEKLKQIISTHAATITAAQSDISKMRKIILNYEAEMTAAKLIVAQKDADLVETRKVHASALSAQDEELSFARDALSSARARIVEVEEEVHMQKEVLAVAKDEIQSLQSKLRAATASAATIPQEYIEQKADLERRLADAEAKAAQVVQLRKQVFELKATIAESSASTSNAASQRAAIYDALKLRVKGLISERDGFAEQVAELQDKVAHLQAASASATGAECSRTIEESATDSLEASNKIAELEKQVADLEASLSAQTSRELGRIAELEKQVAELEATLSTNATQKSREAGRVVELENQVSKLEAALMEASLVSQEAGKIAVLEKQAIDLETLAAKNAARHLEETEITNKLQKRVTELEADLMTRTNHHAEAVDMLKAQLDTLSNEKSLQTDLVATLQNQVSELQDHANHAAALQSQVSELQLSLAEASVYSREAAKTVELQDRVKELENTLAATVTQHSEAIHALNLHISTLSTEKKVLDDLVVTLRRQVTEFETDLAETSAKSREESKVLQETLSGAQTTSLALRETVSDQEDVIMSLKQQIARLQLELQKATESSAVSVISALEAKIKSLEESLADAQESVANLRVQLDSALVSEVQKTQPVSAALEEQVKKMAEELDSMRGQLETAEFRAQKKADQLIQFYENQTNELERSKSTVLSLTARVEELQAEIASCNSKIEERQAIIPELPDPVKSVFDLNDEPLVNESVEENSSNRAIMLRQKFETLIYTSSVTTEEVKILEE